MNGWLEAGVTLYALFVSQKTVKEIRSMDSI